MNLYVNNVIDVDDNFQHKIIASLYFEHKIKSDSGEWKKYNFKEKVFLYCDKETFSNKYIYVIFYTIKTFYEKYKEIPSLTILKTDLKKHSKFNDVLPHLVKIHQFIENSKINLSNIDYVRDNFIPFIYQKKSESLLATMMVDYESHDFKAFQDNVSILNNLPKVLSTPDDDYYMLSNSILREYQPSDDHFYRKTFISPKIDKNIRKGLGMETNELFLIPIRTNGGKSIFSVQIAFNSYINNVDTILIYVEPTTESVKDKVISKIKNINPHKVLSIPKDEKEEIINEFSKNYESKLILKKFKRGTSIKDLNNFIMDVTKLENLRNPRIIIDYFSLFSNNDKKIGWTYQVEILTDLVNCVEDVKGDLFLFEQVGREYRNNRILTLGLIEGDIKKEDQARYIMYIGADMEYMQTKKRYANLAKNTEGDLISFENVIIDENLDFIF